MLFRSIDLDRFLRAPRTITLANQANRHLQSRLDELRYFEYSRKMCWIRLNPKQEVHSGSACASTRTAPFAFVSVQVGLGSPALMLIVPVCGFEVNVKHVLLQPVSQTANNSAAGNGRFQQLRQGGQVLSAKVSPIRHLRIGGSSRRPILYAEGSGPPYLARR